MARSRRPSREEVVAAHRISRPSADRGRGCASQGVLGGAVGAARRLPRARDVTIFLRQLALLIGAGLTARRPRCKRSATTPARRCRAFADALRAVDLGRRQFRRGAGAASGGHRAGLCRHGARRRGLRKARAGVARDRRGPNPTGAARRADQFGGPLPAVSGRRRCR